MNHRFDYFISDRFSHEATLKISSRFFVEATRLRSLLPENKIHYYPSSLFSAIKNCFRFSPFSVNRYF